MLALSDRVLLKLSMSPKRARELSRELAAEVFAVHHVLRGLQAEGFVEEESASSEGGSLWRLTLGVRVEYEPARVVVRGARRPDQPPGRASRCRAVNKRGHPCRLRAMRAERCLFHAPSAHADGLVESGPESGRADQPGGRL